MSGVAAIVIENGVHYAECPHCHDRAALGLWAVAHLAACDMETQCVSCGADIEIERIVTLEEYEEEQREEEKMAHCKYCGRKTVWGGQRVCGTCLRAWKEKRISAYEQATSELGELTPENHKALIKRVKQLEKAAKETPPATG